MNAETIRLSYRAAYAEAVKGVLLILGYRFNNVAFLGTLVFAFVGIGYLMGGGRLEPERLESPLLGYMVWFFGMKAVDHMAFMLSEEARSGTLEQMFMTPAPMGVVMLGRCIGTLWVAAVQVGLVVTAIVLLLRMPIGFDPPTVARAVPVFGLTMVGLFGFGYVVAGVTIVFKQVSSLINMVQNLLLFFGGVMLPVENLPRGVELFARTLPSTQGIAVLRQVVFGGESLGDVWASGALPWLAVHAAAYFILGWVFYGWCEAVAKRQGSLGQY